MPAGRPKKHTPAAMRKKVQEYIKETPKEDLRISGLMLACGIYTYVEFKRYLEYDGFEFLREARLRVQNKYEALLSSKWSHGAQFALARMFGLHEKQEVTKTETVKHELGKDVKQMFEDLKEVRRSTTEVIEIE